MNPWQNEINLLMYATSHLHAALVQTLPTDDKIIVEHMREAKLLCEMARNRLVKGLEGKVNG